MTAVLLPRESRYFAIYTIGKPFGRSGQAVWDLHATAQDKRTALEHARLLALQPNVIEVQVKQVTEQTSSGQICVREIKRCRKTNGQVRMAAAFAGVFLIGLGFVYALI